MASYPYNDTQKKTTGKRNGLAGTSVIHLLLFLLLFYTGFTVPSPAGEGEGILVNFGTDETGSGSIEPSGGLQLEAAKTTAAAARARQRSEDEKLLTQNTEEAPFVKKTVDTPKKKIIDKAEAEKKYKEKLEADRIKKAEEEEAQKERDKLEAERKKIEADQKRQSDIANRTKNALVNARNSGTNSTGEGETGGPGNQGKLYGSVDSKIHGEGHGLGDKGTGTGASGNGKGGTGNGISYDLGGRGSQKLTLPNYIKQEGGIVVVDIRVDRAGKVIQAIPGTHGSTTLDEDLLKVAKEAALQTKFDPKPDAPEVQKGTITYNFILK